MDLDPGKYGTEAGVISAAHREPIDVRQALKVGRSLGGEELARDLVRIVLDADGRTITAVLTAVARVEDELLRARTLFSVLRQTMPKLLKNLPRSAQEKVLALLAGIQDEPARAAALRNMPDGLPAGLIVRLRALAESIQDPLRRLLVVLRYEEKPDSARQDALLRMAKEMVGERERGEALAQVARFLGPSELEQAYNAAQAIPDPDVAGPARVRIAHHFAEERRARAHAEILEMSSAIQNPVLRFGVMAELEDLPPEGKAKVETLLYELAVSLEDAALRCRALFTAGGFAENEERRNRALLAGIAAAELVRDEQERSELFLLLRQGAPWLATDVRRGLTRAVERMSDGEAKRELYSTLGRFFVYERPPGPEATVQPAVREEKYDLFVSYSSKDTEQARQLAHELESRGVRVFLAGNSMDAAVRTRSWSTAIDDALVTSRALLVLLTENSVRSPWVNEEWGKYYQNIVETGFGRLLTLRLSGPPREQLPLTLRRFQIIESESGRLERGQLTRILDILRGG